MCSSVCCILVCVCMPHYTWNNSKPQLSLNVRAVSLNQWRPFLFQTSSATTWKSIDLNLSLQRPAVFSSYESVHCVEIAFCDSEPIPRQQQQEHQMLSLSLFQPYDNIQSSMLILNKCQLLSAICLFKPGPFPSQPTSSGHEALSTDKSA